MGEHDQPSRIAVDSVLYKRMADRLGVCSVSFGRHHQQHQASQASAKHLYSTRLSPLLRVYGLNRKHSAHSWTNTLLLLLQQHHYSSKEPTIQSHIMSPIVARIATRAAARRNFSM